MIRQASNIAHPADPAEDGDGAPVEARRVEVIALNFKRRLTGVTSSIIQLVPVQARAIAIVALGIGLPPRIPRLSWLDLPKLWRKPHARPFRIWHARRNNEMLAGIILRTILRFPLKVIFTSPEQHPHSWFTLFLIRNMDRVIATSERSGSFLEVPHTVILHGIDCSRFHPPAELDDRFETSGLPGQYAVGCFGRVRPQKGTDLFVDAMIRLLPEFPQWTAIICGRVTSAHRPFYDDLRNRIAAAGLTDRIIFMGEVPEIPAWYRRLSLYVAPSRNEGFGLTCLEAMASQTAVVASDAGAYREVIKDSGGGEIVPPGNLEALVAATRKYLCDPDLAARHGHHAAAHVKTNFPIENEAAAVNALYQRLWSGQN
jgi:mannosyltransferase